jgi:SSS family solute:Na+ symporter
VELAAEPTPETISAWPPNRYLLALYPNEQSLNAARTSNPYVLPLTQPAHEALAPSPFTLFLTEDAAWRHINPGIAEEIEQHNAQVNRSATAANAKPVVEKLIAFKYDTALAQLLGHVLPQGVGLVGFVFAALLGAVVSSLAAMLNAASTIFAMDIFKRHLAPHAEQKTVVLLGRASVVVFTGVAIFLAPQLGNPKISNSIFTIIQEGQGFISPGILAVFVFGLLVRRAPPVCGVVGLLTNIVAYGTLKLAVPDLQFLNRMAVCFGLCLLLMSIIRLLKPLSTPVVFQTQTSIDLQTSNGAKLAGALVIAIALLFYLLFSPLGLIR